NSETPVVPSGTPQPEPAPNSLDARISEYQAKLDQLLLEYTERHPDVINTRETLERLEQQRAEQLAALGVTGDVDVPLSALDANPVYQTLRMSLNDVEVEIDALQEDVRDRNEKLAELQALVDEVPEVE